MVETFHNSHVLLAFFALSNADIVVARNVLGEHQAGLYAGGLILTKAVLFLPQFVVVIAFPSLSTAAERRRALSTSLSLVAVLGAVATAGAALLPRLALVFVGGSKYDELAGRLWVFAILGTILSMLQLLVYAVLAQQGQRAVYLVWGAFVTMVGVGLTTTDLRDLLPVVIGVDAALLAVLFLLSLRTTPRPVVPPVETPV
jgi:O-antigen/teichoic acid export membrane protein